MVLNFHYLFGRYVHHISAGNNFSVTLRHNGLHQNWGRKYFFQNGVKRICFYLSPTFISNSSMFIHATCCHVWTSWSLVVAWFCISAGKNVVFFSISAGNNVVFAPFTKHNIKYSLNSGYYLYSWHTICTCKNCMSKKRRHCLIFEWGFFAL